MNGFIGSVLYILGGLTAIYVGVWLCFVGGIIGIVHEIKYTADGLSIAINILKIMFSGVLGYLSSMVFILPGMYFMDKADRK